MNINQIAIGLISGIISSIITTIISWFLFKKRFSHEQIFTTRIELYKDLIDHILNYLNELFKYLILFKSKEDKMPLKIIFDFSNSYIKKCRKISLFSTPATFHLSLETIQEITKISNNIDKESEYKSINPAQEEHKIMNKLFQLMNQMRNDLHLSKLTEEWKKTQNQIIKNGYDANIFLKK